MTILLTGMLFENVMLCIQERAHILAHRVTPDGWMFVRVATAKQAARCLGRLDKQTIYGGMATLRAWTSPDSDWPPGFVPPQSVPDPEVQSWHKARHRGGRQQSGGIRHRRTTQKGASAASSAI